MSRQRVEATAPCFVALAGGPVAVRVAIDRRVWCLVETGVDGVQLESKDTRQKSREASVAELLDRAGSSLVAHVLSVLGLERGVRVVTQRRVPAGSGLGEVAAEVVAVAGAAAAAAGRPIDPEALRPVLREAEARSGLEATAPGEYEPALRGGVLTVRSEADGDGAAPLPVDPARIEESLLLIDGGEAPERSGWPSLEGRVDRDESLRDSLAVLSLQGERVETALIEGRFGDVVGLLAEGWEVHERLWPGATTPDIERIAKVVRGAGGATRVCGEGRGRVVAVWAPPGDRGPGCREAVEGALAAAGIRVFPARVDLRGLEVG